MIMRRLLVVLGLTDPMAGVSVNAWIGVGG